MRLSSVNYVIVENIKLLPARASDFATQKHKDQIRKFSGEEYVEHPKRVAKIIEKFKKSSKLDQLVKAAFLHDTLEDTNTTLYDLKKLYGGLVASLVKELTSDDNKIMKVGKAAYLSDKMNKMSSWGLVIKLADRLDNVSDIKIASPGFAKKYSKETNFILKSLERERKLSNTQKRIISAIKDKIKEAGY